MPPIQNRTRSLSAVTPVLTIFLILAAAGCARTPPGVTTASGSQVIITVQFAGAISPSDYYVVMFNPVTTAGQSTGPEPAVAAPWGINSSTPDSATAFVLFTENPSLPDLPAAISNEDYYVYAVNQSNPLQYSPLSALTQVTAVNGSTLQFEIPLSEIPTTDVTTGSQAGYMQVCIMATDNITQIPSPQDNVPPRNLGVLGTGLSSFFTLPINQSTPASQTVSGEVFLDGPAGSLEGTTQPALQITYYSVQIVGVPST